MEYIYHDVIVEHRYWGALTKFMWCIEQYGLNSVEAMDAYTAVNDCKEAGSIYYG